jgi:N-acetylneuraminate synthase
MTPRTWREMVDRTRELERALGSADKFVTENEDHTVIVQRRCLRAGREIRAGEVFTREMIAVLRPATPGAICPDEIERVIGTRAITDIPAGKELRWVDLGE